MNNCAITFTSKLNIYQVLNLHPINTSLMLISNSINWGKSECIIHCMQQKTYLESTGIFIVKITFGWVVKLADMYIQPYNKSITFSNYAENNSLSIESIQYYGRKIHLHSIHPHTNKLKLSDLLHTWTNCLLTLQVYRQVPMPEKKDIKNKKKKRLAEETHSTQYL